MRCPLAFVALVPLALLMALPPVAEAARPSGDPYRIVLSRRAVSAGEWVDLRLAPPAPADARVTWIVASGTSGIGLNGTVYRAPYSIPPGTPPVKVSAGIRIGGATTVVSTEIELIPGTAPGAGDCLGPGQSFSTVLGDLEQAFPHITDGGNLIHRVDPIYPRSALARGIGARITVSALVCRTGHVLDAYAPLSYRNISDPQPIDYDPKLVDAALAAVRQYVFAPATADGQPVAFWVVTEVVFEP